MQIVEMLACGVEEIQCTHCSFDEPGSVIRSETNRYIGREIEVRILQSIGTHYWNENKSSFYAAADNRQQ